MRDRREEVLRELYAALLTLEGEAVGNVTVKNVFRNRGEIPEHLRPAISLMDGDEEADERARGRGRPAESPNLVVMRPEIFWLLDQREPKNENAGTDLNRARVMILRAVIGHTPLRDAVGDNGAIDYVAAATDMKTGSSMQGQFQIGVEFRYPFLPRELMEP